MPRYFFDIDDGERQARDEVGMDLPSVDDLPRETKLLLQDLGFNELLKGRPRVFIASVRDEKGREAYRGTIVLTINHDEPKSYHT